LVFERGNNLVEMGKWENVENEGMRCHTNLDAVDCGSVENFINVGNVGNVH
jgi:hypothetical protein